MPNGFLAAGEARQQIVAGLADCDSENGDISDEEIRLSAARIAAARLCPCPSRTLVQAVMTSLEGVSDSTTRDTAVEAIEALVASGDLVTGIAKDEAGARLLLYLSPPLYVRRPSGVVLVLGGLPEVGFPVTAGVECHGAYRQLRVTMTDDELHDAGISPMPMEVWLDAPRTLEPHELISRLDGLLASAGPPGEAEELQILDTTRPANYYLGRFVAPGGHTGAYLARRRRRWGGQRWSYVRLRSGSVEAMIDLPKVDTRFSDRDEAWWLICAIDALRGEPQVARLTVDDGQGMVALNTPLPSWAERSINSIGAPSAVRPRGALSAFDITGSELEAETDHLARLLWLQVVRE